MGHLLESFEGSDVVQSFNAGRQPSVEAEELILDDSSEREEVEELGETFPDIGVSIFSAALIVEAIDLGNLPGLVVASQDGDSIFVPDFEGDQEGDCFHTMMSLLMIFLYLCQRSRP